MARNRKVCLFARLQQDGKQIAVTVKRSGNASIEPVRDGVYWLRWTYQGKRKCLNVGRDHRVAVDEATSTGKFPSRAAVQPDKCANRKSGFRYLRRGVPPIQTRNDRP